MAMVAQGAPTKEFFVEMLTRDIDLSDAILDLLDNCLDGVIRAQNGKHKLGDRDFYKGFYANITITSDQFVISDNCGGIPRDVAEKYAFRMGRPSEENKSNLPTVGIYGIGMKRAIFKMGKEAIVHTKTAQGNYSVLIPTDWAENSDNWDFKIIENRSDNTLPHNGTKIIISSLNPDISDLWNNKDKIENYVDTLKRVIKETYSRILEKGFSVTINESSVQYAPVELLVSKSDEKTGIRPYLFSTKYNDVQVRLAIGFYDSPPSDDEIDDMNSTRRTSTDAGITIVCNDRVVLYNDKSSLTGWGVNGVPHYHTQFIGIKGIVVFESNNPEQLPMTTTKRGVDHSSSLYILVKDRICEGLKTFTNYTNKWKGRNADERTYSTSTNKIAYDQLFDGSKGMQLHKAKVGETYKPALPMPKNDKPFRTIRYSRSRLDIKILMEYFFGDTELEINSSVVGEKSFDFVLDIAKREKS